MDGEVNRGSREHAQTTTASAEPEPGGGAAPRDPSSGARCAQHPDRPALCICDRCGTFCCAACIAGTGPCRSCRSREDTTPPSALAVASAVIGLSALVCGFVPGALAIALAQLELHRIATGRAPESGRGWAQGGRALGIIALALGTLLFIAWACT